MTGSITELRMALGEVTERLNSAYRCARDAEQGLAQAIAVLTELDRSSADRMVPQDLLRADQELTRGLGLINGGTDAVAAIDARL
jgi:hypothetical protein